MFLGKMDNPNPSSLALHWRRYFPPRKIRPDQERRDKRYRQAKVNALPVPERVSKTLAG